VLPLPAPGINWMGTGVGGLSTTPLLSKSWKTMSTRKLFGLMGPPLLVRTSGMTKFLIKIASLKRGVTWIEIFTAETVADALKATRPFEEKDAPPGVLAPDVITSKRASARRLLTVS